MNMSGGIRVQAKSKTIFYVGMVAAVLLLVASQVVQSVLIPASGTVPSPTLIAFGSSLTFLAFLSTLAMIYSMLLRRKGQ